MPRSPRQRAASRRNLAKARKRRNHGTTILKFLVTKTASVSTIGASEKVSDFAERIQKSEKKKKKAIRASRRIR
jgi:hypothetical protein